MEKLYFVTPLTTSFNRNGNRLHGYTLEVLDLPSEGNAGRLYTKPIEAVELPTSGMIHKKLLEKGITTYVEQPEQRLSHREFKALMKGEWQI